MYKQQSNLNESSLYVCFLLVSFFWTQQKQVELCKYFALLSFTIEWSNLFMAIYLCILWEKNGIYSFRCALNFQYESLSHSLTQLMSKNISVVKWLPKIVNKSSKHAWVYGVPSSQTEEIVAACRVQLCMWILTFSNVVSWAQSVLRLKNLI